MIPDDPEESRPAVRGRLAAVAARIVPARDDEVGALLWACVYVFSLLAGNYILRPLRDAMGIAGGRENLPWLMTGTLVAVLLAYPLLSALVARLPRSRFVPLLYRILQLNLLGFFLVLRADPGDGSAAVGRGFFVWASVWNLFVTSVAWGFLDDLFTSDQGKRLFGFVAAGGTLGAIAGSALSSALAGPIGPTNLLLLAVGFLELGIFAARRLLARADRGEPVEPPAGPGGDGGGAGRAGASRYLMGLGASMLLFTISSSFVYLEQARLVEATLGGPAEQTAFFARVDLLANLVGLAMQVFLTGRAIAALGVGATAALLPLVTIAGLVTLSAWPALTVLAAFQVLRRAVDYAFARPSREVMFTVVSRADKYRAKSLIDAALYRAGDSLGAWGYGLLAALPGGARGASLVVIPLMMAWTAVCLWLGRRQEELAHPESTWPRPGADDPGIRATGPWRRGRRPP